MKNGRAFHLEEIGPYLADGGDPEDIYLSMYQGDPKRWSMAGLNIDTDKEISHKIDYVYLYYRNNKYYHLVQIQTVKGDQLCRIRK